MSHYFKITTILQEIPSARLKLAVRQALSWEVTGRLDSDSELAHTNWELSRAMGLEGDPRQQITRTMPLLVKEAARRWVEPDHDCQWLSWLQQAHRWQGRWVLGNFAGIGAAARVRDWNECNGGWCRAQSEAPWPAPQSFSRWKTSAG